MVRIARLASKQLSRFTPAAMLFQAKAPVLLPFYHTVSSKPLPYILNYPYINKKQFEQQLDFYLKHFKPVTLEYIFQNPNPKEKVFHLSFDDGLRSCAEIIAPLLIKKGIPATFFINSGFVDNKALFHRYKASLILTEMHLYPDSEAETLLAKNKLTRQNLLQSPFAKRDILDEAAELLEIDFDAFLSEEKPYLTSSQIKDLSHQGFSIGGHSHKHPEFWQISEKKQFKHIRKSIDWVNENIKPQIKAFSFPFTDDKVSINLFKRIKDENICDITFGTAGLKYDKISTHFQRYPVEQIGNFEENLKTEFMYFKLRKAIRKAQVKH